MVQQPCQCVMFTSAQHTDDDAYVLAARMGGHEGGGLGGVRRNLVLHVIGEEDPLQGDRRPVHRVGPHDRCQRSLDVVTGVELVLLDARQGIRRPGNQVLRQGRFRFSQLLRVDESEQPGRHPPAGLVDE